MAKKRAMITGASEGIGREFCIQLAREGYHITAIARNEDRLKELRKDIGELTIFVADLTVPSKVLEIAAEFKANHYDLVINNAGFGVYGKFHDVPISKLQEMARLNCDALVHLSHTYLLTAKPGDALVNVASVLSFLPSPGAALYAATKAFVTSLSESLWFEQKDRGVFVMNLCPGITSTLFQQRAGGSNLKTPPAAITQTAEEVVKKALKAIHRRKTPTVISGAKNWTFAFATRLMPRKTVLKLIASMR